MSDDLNNKIKQIADLLGQDNMPDNVKGLISLLANSASGESSSPKEVSKSSGENTKNSDDIRQASNDLAQNMDMIRKATSLMSRMNSVSDPRINLLQAIKPFLNNRRQTKLNNCVNILRMSSLVRLIDDNEKGS